MCISFSLVLSFFPTLEYSIAGFKTLQKCCKFFQRGEKFNAKIQTEKLNLIGIPGCGSSVRKEVGQGHSPDLL